MVDVAKRGEDAAPISKLDLTALADEIQRTKRPKRIACTGGEDLILLRAADYEELQAALDLAVGMLRGTADLAAGRVYTHEQAMAMVTEQIEAARTSRMDECRAD